MSGALTGIIGGVILVALCYFLAVSSTRKPSSKDEKSS